MVHMAQFLIYMTHSVMGSSINSQLALRFTLPAMEIVNICHRVTAYAFTMRMSITMSITKQTWSQFLKLLMFITPNSHLSNNRSEANACLKAINNVSKLETTLQKEQKQSKIICYEIFKCTFFLFVFCYKKHLP